MIILIREETTNKKEGRVMTTEKYLGNTGDINWVEYGGTLVMQDTDGSLRGVHVDPWMLDSGEASGEFDPKMKWEVSIFCITQLELTADNRLVCPVSKTEEWFSDDATLGSIASCLGSSIEDLKKAFTSNDPFTLACAYDDLAICHGYVNLNCSPEMLTRSQLAWSWFGRLEREAREARETLDN